MREMKDSGVDWIGMIPSHWGTLENKFYCERIYSGGTPDSNNPNYWDGDIPWIPSGSCQDCLITSAPKSITQDGLNNSSTRYIPAGTTVMAMTGATCSKVGYVTFDTCMNQSVIAFVENKKICSSKYLYYLYQAAREYILTFQTGGAQSGINGQNCRNLVMPFLPLSEQQRIADFLDRKCAEIDKVLVKTKTSIEEYKKLKQSVITKAVTKGIRGERPMKDSGIEWIGEIPKEWTVIKFGYCAHIKSNLVDPSLYPDYPQIAPDVIGKGNAKIEGEITSVKESGIISWNHLFSKGQIIYSKIRPLLNKLIIAPFDGLCSADMYPIESDLDISFTKYMMLSSYFLEQVKQVTEDRVKMPKVNQEELSAFKVVIPPCKSEQVAIASYLDQKCSEIDSLIASKEKFITELELYKKSLIYEYVTGKKEVL